MSRDRRRQHIIVRLCKQRIIYIYIYSIYIYICLLSFGALGLEPRAPSLMRGHWSVRSRSRTGRNRGGRWFSAHTSCAASRTERRKRRAERGTTHGRQAHSRVLDFDFFNRLWRYPAPAAALSRAARTSF